MNLKNRQQLLGILAIAAVSLLVLDRMIITPLAHTWKDRTEQIDKLKKSVLKGNQLLARDKVIRERWSNMQTNALSSEVSIAENQVFRSLDRCSQESRITVNGIKPQWKRAGDDYATFECRVDATGNLGQITRFIYEIEKDPLGLKLDSVEITAHDDRGQQLTLGLQVSGLQLNPPPAP